MSSQTHRIELQAKDGTRPAFEAIKRSALDDVKALQQMGKEGSKSLKEIETTAKNAQSGMDRFRSAQRDLAVGASALAGAFALSSRAAQGEAREHDALSRLYRDQAQEIEDLSEAIQDNTNFSNDAARQAAITGSTLVQNYQLSADQIGVLIERSADLAQIHGVDLADAMSRVSGAIRGEGEAAELLGLNMSDSAVATAAAARGLEGWNTTMSEAEKAAFRYQLVLEQTEATQGAAADAADTTAGRVRHLANEVQDAAQDFATWTGPVGESVSVLSDYALQTGLALAGVTQLAKGLQGMGAASKLASAALSPGGLVVAAGLALFAVGKLADSMGTTYLEAAEDADRATANLAETINRLGQAGNPRTTLGTAWKESFEAAIAPLMAIQDQLNDIDTQRQGIAAQPSATEEDAAKRKALLLQLAEEEDRLKAIADQYGGTTAIAQEFAETETAIGQIIANNGPGSEKVLQIQQGFKDAYESGRISLAQYMSMTQFLAETMGVYDEAAIRAAGATDRVGETVKKTTEITERAVGKWQEYDLAVRQSRQADIDRAKANQDLLDSMTVEKVEEATQLDRNKQKWNEYDAAVREHYDTRAQSSQDAADYLVQLEEERAKAEAARAATMDYADALGVLDSYAEKLRPIDLTPRGGDRATGTAADLERTGQALDSVLGLFGQIDAMGQQAGESAGIASLLVGTPEEAGKAIALLEQGRISRTRYNMTIEAGNAILGRQAEVEADLDVIRAKQLPFLNEADAAYADLIDKVSHLSAAEQVVTLGFMDATEAGKAQQAVMLAAAAAAGELGENGEAAATRIIEGAVAADPVLEAMLTDIGLVARDHEGNLVVNFPEGESLNDLVKGLTESIDALTTALGGVPPEVNTHVGVSGAQEAIDAANNLSAALNAIPQVVGTSVTTTHQDVYIGEPPKGQGGMVGAAQGRLIGQEYMKVRVNEGGREMATLPTGDDVWLQPGTMVWPHASSVMGNRGNGGGGRTFNNYGHMTILANNPSEFYDQWQSQALAGR